MPLVSLGYMCVSGWKHKGRNPAGIPCVTREYPHGSTEHLKAGAAPAKQETASRKKESTDMTAASGGEEMEKKNKTSSVMAQWKLMLSHAAEGLSSTLPTVMNDGVLRGVITLLRVCHPRSPAVQHVFTLLITYTCTGGTGIGRHHCRPCGHSTEQGLADRRAVHCHRQGP